MRYGQEQTASINENRIFSLEEGIPSDQWESRPPQAFCPVVLPVRSCFPSNKFLQDGDILLSEWIRESKDEDLLVGCRILGGLRLDFLESD